MQTTKSPVKVKKRAGFWRILGILALVLLISASGLAVFGWVRLQAMLEPVGDSDRPVLISVPRGASSAAVGNILAESGLIHNSTVFRLWLRYYKLDGRIQAGDYILSENLSLSEIAEKMIQGDVHYETVQFTVPEGLFISDIAARLAKQGLVDEERFLELAGDLDMWQDYWFVQQIPQGMEEPLEGYLFPKTYEIFASSENREELIIAIMLRQFDKEFTQEMRDMAEARGMTVHEVVTLASIVEKEAVVDHERPVIAGVFFNRLERPMLLQSCATVNYILGDFSIRPTTAQLETKHPYNTYTNLGLPPGPIAGAGKRALEAVIWPEETNYYYFVAKDDGSGEHYFGRTLADHEYNILKAKANRNK